MRIPWRILYHLIVLPVILILLTGIQTSFWLQLLGPFPTPQLWIVVLTYLITHRPFWISLGMGYLFSVILTGFTAWPFEYILTSAMVLVGVSQLLKDRIYSSGPNYFIALCGWNVFLFHVCYTFLGMLKEDIPFARVSLFDFILSPLLSVLLAFPVFSGLRMLDRIFKEDADLQTGNSIT
ncbi:MAG TPA: hypothetical protein DCL41_08825 [Bdellovibrionales bacterium]|nr:hypothetical protein [Pseudobdellovibrionaceae bacterium]HAG91962.1 hypothetical protein [Bdellovibrionales bacterium]|tara:strand:- start:322 stop:861 length:540 start_codon:yes stop_codon:yes gene_type:complete